MLGSVEMKRLPSAAELGCEATLIITCSHHQPRRPRVGKM